MSTKLYPLRGFVVVRKIDETQNEITHTPEGAKEKPQKGLVVASDCEQVSVGDTIIFARYAGSDVDIDGELLTIMREEEVLARIEVEAVQTKKHTRKR